MKNIRNCLTTISLMLAAVFVYITPFAVFAQDGSAPPTTDAVIQQAFGVLSQWKTGGAVIGLIAAVNVLMNLTKIQWVKDHLLNVRPWLMPLASVLFAGLLAGLGALQAHAAPMGAIIAAITAGLGAVGFHELVNSFNSSKQLERSVGSKIVDAIKQGDGSAMNAAAALHAQLNSISGYDPQEQAKVAAAWANNKPPLAAAAAILALLFTFPAMAQIEPIPNPMPHVVLAPSVTTADATPVATPVPVRTGGTLADVAPSDPPPATPTRFGGCNKVGTLCYGPAANLSLVLFNMRTKDFTLGVVPGVGYGVTFFASQPYKLGVGFFGNFKGNSANSPSSGMASAVVSFAEYVRIGAAYEVIGGNGTPYLLGSIGANL